jgi:predicted nuclease of predicted toxin-antitoxin system
LRYIALEEGVSFNDQIWEFGGIYEKDGMWKRTMKKIWREDVKDVEIWKMAREDEDS